MAPPKKKVKKLAAIQTQHATASAKALMMNIFFSK